MGVRISGLRQGDWAILVGAASIAAYEKFVRDDDDLISCRVAAYKRRYPLLTTSIILMTAGHLLEWVRPEYDVYHQLVRYFRRHQIQAANPASTITISGTVTSST